MKRPDAILTSDWHLREDTPTCRTDDFWEAQWNKVEQINQLQKKFDCYVLHAGDLFHHWKPSPYLLSMTIASLPKQFRTVYGQHDLPQHNWDQKEKSGIHTLSVAKAVFALNTCNWGQIPRDPSLIFIGSDRPVLVWHKFVWDGKKIPWPGCDEYTALEILKEYPDFDLIVTGDHHKPFVKEYDGRLLVNPGCLTRQSADYSSHKPRIYLWYAEENKVEPYYLQIAEDVVSRDHIEKQEIRDKRIDAFISRLNTEWELSVSFEENLKRFLSENRMRQSVKDFIYKAIE